MNKPTFNRLIAPCTAEEHRVSRKNMFVEITIDAPDGYHFAETGLHSIVIDGALNDEPHTGKLRDMAYERWKDECQELERCDNDCEYL